MEECISGASGTLTVGMSLTPVMNRYYCAVTVYCTKKGDANGVFIHTVESPSATCVHVLSPRILQSYHSLALLSSLTMVISTTASAGRTMPSGSV